MKMLAVSLSFISAVSVGLTGCGRGTVGSDQLTPNNTDRSYDLIYSEKTRQYSFEATFSVKGDWRTTVKLNPPSELKVNGQPVSNEKHSILAGLLGTVYSADLADLGPSQSVLIEWKDNAGEDYRDTMTMQPFRFSAPSQIAASQDISLPISNPLPGAAYTARLEGKSAEKPDATAYANAKFQNGALVFPQADVAKLARGSVTLTVDQSVPVPVSDHGHGNKGQGHVIYRVGPQSVNLN